LDVTNKNLKIVKSKNCETNEWPTKTCIVSVIMGHATKLNASDAFGKWKMQLFKKFFDWLAVGKVKKAICKFN